MDSKFPSTSFSLYSYVYLNEIMGLLDTMKHVRIYNTRGSFKSSATYVVVGIYSIILKSHEFSAYTYIYKSMCKEI